MLVLFVNNDKIECWNKELSYIFGNNENVKSNKIFSLFCGMHPY